MNTDKTFNGGFALISLACLVGAFSNFYYGWMFLLLSILLMGAQIYVIYSK